MGTCTRRLRHCCLILFLVVSTAFGANETPFVPAAPPPYPKSAHPTSEEFTSIVAAAESGDCQSRLSLASFYANGIIVEQDFSMAAAWYRMAADAGSARAQTCLAMLYECGLGVERDYEKACSLYMTAAEKRDAAAHLGVSRLLIANRRQAFGNGFRWHDLHFTRSLVERNPAFSFMGGYRSWRNKAYLLAGMDSRDAESEVYFWHAYNYGETYFWEQDVVTEAVREMADGGDAEAQLTLGLLLLGEPGSWDLRRASPWSYIRLAAQNGNPYAQHMAASDHLFGHGSGDKNIASRLQMLGLSAVGDGEPLFMYEYILLRMNHPWLGAVDKEEFSLAIRVLAKANYAPAQFVMAKVLFDTANDDEGLKFLEKSGKVGFQHAVAFLLAGYWESGIEAERKKADELVRSMLESNDLRYAGLLIALLADRRDFPRAWYEKKADTDLPALLLLGMHDEAHGRTAQALSRYVDAARRRSGLAAYLIGRLCRLGKAAADTDAVAAAAQTTERFRLLQAIAPHVRLDDRTRRMVEWDFVGAEFGFAPALFEAAQTIGALYWNTYYNESLPAREELKTLFSGLHDEFLQRGDWYSVNVQSVMSREADVLPPSSDLDAYFVRALQFTAK